MPLSFDPDRPTYISFEGNVDTFSTNELNVILGQLVHGGAKEIQLGISSEGGDVSKGNQLYSFLRSLPIDLTTHNIGDVDSIANVIFLAGKRRYANSNARFMLHGVARRIKARDGFVSLGEQELMEALEYVRKDHQRIAKTIAKHTKLTTRKIVDMFRRGDVIFTPAEAESVGMIHGVKEWIVSQGSNVFTVHNTA